MNCIFKVSRIRLLPFPPLVAPFSLGAVVVVRRPAPALSFWPFLFKRSSRSSKVVQIIRHRISKLLGLNRGLNANGRFNTVPIVADPSWLRVLLATLPAVIAVASAFIGVVLTNRNNLRTQQMQLSAERSRTEVAGKRSAPYEINSKLASWLDAVLKQVVC